MFNIARIVCFGIIAPMERDRSREKDFFINDGERVRTATSPRVIILDNNGGFPLVPYENTSWQGLPGGKMKESEIIPNANQLSAGSFPTLVREVKEECDIDITNSLNKSACLGLAEIGIVDAVKKQVTLLISPIFLCRTENLDNLSPSANLVNIKEHLPGPLFPDARLAIKRLKEGMKEEKGPIYPEWLNDKGIYYFELRPEMKLLTRPPSWMY